ncbi:hypothetical protein VTK73DRAFT_9831 [Phialemonium thermophilum]|uniref:Uncharacterized protein n=1 Tax=Phialemonium thermophilum TaxID=223376 RepID=A0ABR3W045_9PEZI
MVSLGGPPLLNLIRLGRKVPLAEQRANRCRDASARRPQPVARRRGPRDAASDVSPHRADPRDLQEAVQGDGQGATVPEERQLHLGQGGHGRGRARLPLRHHLPHRSERAREAQVRPQQAAGRGPPQARSPVQGRPAAAGPPAEAAEDRPAGARRLGRQARQHGRRLPGERRRGTPEGHRAGPHHEEPAEDRPRAVHGRRAQEQGQDRRRTQDSVKRRAAVERRESTRF